MNTEPHYVNDKFPISVDVFESDGVTPVTPQSATATVTNQYTGSVVVSNVPCAVAEGLATYYVGTDVSGIASKYTAYIAVTIDSNNTWTQAVNFVVINKVSSRAADRWISKVRDSAPSPDHLSDENARDWVDQAVDFINRHYETGYTSVLGTITPTPTPNDLELITSVGALMARTAWYAGRGNWKDDDASMDTSPFFQEWQQLKIVLGSLSGSSWVEGSSFNMFNRDRTLPDGIIYSLPEYWEEPVSY